MIKTNMHNDWTCEINTDNSDYGQEVTTVESDDQLDVMMYFHLLCYFMSWYNYMHM